MTGALAKRYARALAAAAREAGRLEEVARELRAVAGWLADPDLGPALASPVIKPEKRNAFLAEIARSLELSDLSKNFLSLLAENQRLGEIQGIDRSYQLMVDRELGRVRGVLQTARPLPDTSIEEIRQGLSKAHDCEVLLSTETEESLVGGVTVEIEGRVYDGSVRTQFAELTRSLTRGEGTT